MNNNFDAQKYKVLKLRYVFLLIFISDFKQKLLSKMRN